MLCYIYIIYTYVWNEQTETNDIHKNKSLRWLKQDPDSKVQGANMGSIWGRQDPGGPHVGPMNFTIWGLSFNQDE